ncbi:MAG: sel1 repeat family protein [Clostridiales bacterium]|nr:sel1 repeat family protein [Clostridiales bacterium]
MSKKHRKDLRGFLLVIIGGILILKVFAPMYLNRITNVLSSKWYARNLARYEAALYVGWGVIGVGIVGVLVTLFKHMRELKQKQAERDDTALLIEEATRGNVQAMKDLADRYEKGVGTAVNSQQAQQWYKAAAETGDAQAQFMYAGYFWDNGDQTDYALAYQWYHRSATQGYAAAYNALGVFYRDGLGMPADYASAYECFRRAGEGGDRRGWYHMSLMHLEGQGVAKDREQALELLRKASRLGLRAAENKLAELTGGKTA